MAGQIAIRDGSAADAGVLLLWFDEAVRWLVARGQTGQWGSKPFSEQPRRVQRVRTLASGGGLRIAEQDGHPVGAIAVGDAPAYAPPVNRPEVYITLLLTSREHAGKRIGDVLVRRASDEARAANRELLRVDCWSALLASYAGTRIRGSS